MVQPLVMIKGAGDLASGVAHRLASCGFSVVMLEIAKPTVIRRTVSFAEAVYQQEHTVEGVTARLAGSPEEVSDIIQRGAIAVLVDPQWQSIKMLRPTIVIDAILAKKNLGTTLSDAPIVIGLGPGFVAGQDAHAVIETKRGHYLGRVLYTGATIPNTGIPGVIGGYSSERVLRSPIAGTFQARKAIGELVQVGDVVATIDDLPIPATLSGVIRGLLHDGLFVDKGFKIGDIDPRDVLKHCFSISDKARSIGGGALEAVIHLLYKGDYAWMPTSKQPYATYVPAINP